MSDHFTSSERIEFDAHTAASKALADWFDENHRTAHLIGCTPAMLSEIAVNAYCNSIDASLGGRS